MVFDFRVVNYGRQERMPLGFLIIGGSKIVSLVVDLQHLPLIFWEYGFDL